MCRAWAQEGADEGAVALADHQSHGRGRLNRTWTAPPGTALLWSCLVRAPLPADRWPELTLLAGCAVAEGVEAATGLPARLRWPNDVLVDGKKVAGILAEGVVNDVPAIILGVGINVHQAPEDWPPSLRERAASLAMLGATASREAVFQAVCERLGARYDALLATGFEAVRAAWRARGLLGVPVRARTGEEGTAVDLETNGALLIRLRDGSVVAVTAAGTLA